MWWIVGVGCMLVIISVAVYFGTGCPKGGRHHWLLIAFSRGEQPMHRRVLWMHDYFDAPAYVKLVKCPKCKEEHAYKWVGVDHSEFNYDKEVNLAWAKSILRESGALKE